MPPWGKAISIIGIGIAGLLVYNQINKAVKSQKDKKEAEKLTKQAESELLDLKRKGINPSYSNSQYEAMCLKLQEAMNGCGTDEEAVMAVFEQMKNKADVLKLISAFGIRYYRPCAATQPISYSLYLTDNTAFGGTIPTWLQYDLSAGEIQDVNDMLKAKKIDYTF